MAESEMETKIDFLNLRLAELLVHAELLEDQMRAAYDDGVLRDKMVVGASYDLQDASAAIREAQESFGKGVQRVREDLKDAVEEVK